MNRKIGVFGGTFNPIHNGHLSIARCAADQFFLDAVIFVPTGHTAYKDYAGEDMSLHRCRMVELAIADEPLFFISRDEVESGTVCYTWQTLGRMRQEYPDAELCFLIGGDSLRDFPTWRHPEIICEEAVILVAARADCGDAGRLAAEYAARYNGNFRLLDTPMLDISSTEIRRRAEEHLDIRGMVPPAVADYIYSNGLYL